MTIALKEPGKLIMGPTKWIVPKYNYRSEIRGYRKHLLTKNFIEKGKSLSKKSFGWVMVDRADYETPVLGKENRYSLARDYGRRRRTCFR